MGLGECRPCSRCADIRTCTPHLFGHSPRGLGRLLDVSHIATAANTAVWRSSPPCSGPRRGSVGWWPSGAGSSSLKGPPLNSKGAALLFLHQKWPAPTDLTRLPTEGALLRDALACKLAALTVLALAAEIRAFTDARRRKIKFMCLAANSAAYSYFRFWRYEPQIVASSLETAVECSSCRKTG